MAAGILLDIEDIRIAVIIAVIVGLYLYRAAQAASRGKKRNGKPAPKRSAHINNIYTDPEPEFVPVEEIIEPVQEVHAFEIHEEGIRVTSEAPMEPIAKKTSSLRARELRRALILGEILQRKQY